MELTILIAFVLMAGFFFVILSRGKKGDNSHDHENCCGHDHGHCHHDDSHDHSHGHQHAHDHDCGCGGKH